MKTTLFLLILFLCACQKEECWQFTTIVKSWPVHYSSCAKLDTTAIVAICNITQKEARNYWELNTEEGYIITNGDSIQYEQKCHGMRMTCPEY